MGVKVTFLREADRAATPVAQAVTLVPQGAVKNDSGNTLCSWCRTTRSSAAP
jgi:hypothetical protein